MRDRIVSADSGGMVGDEGRSRRRRAMRISAYRLYSWLYSNGGSDLFAVFTDVGTASAVRTGKMPMLPDAAEEIAARPRAVRTGKVPMLPNREQGWENRSTDETHRRDGRRGDLPADPNRKR